jgi:hypothetical protein
MITKNNWCTSNLKDRFANKNSKFEVYLNPQQFQKIDFKFLTSNKLLTLLVL